MGLIVPLPLASLIFVFHVSYRSGAPFQSQGWPSTIKPAANFATFTGFEIPLSSQRVSPILFHATPEREICPV